MTGKKQDDLWKGETTYTKVTPLKEPNSDIQSMLQKLGVLIDQIRDSEKRHRETILKLLEAHGSRPEDFGSLSVSDLHTIDCIGSHDSPNLTFISENTGLTKSAITKISTKLLNQDLIATYKREENKKEILYSLTEKGELAFKIHRKFHDQKDKKLIKMLEGYQKDEIQIILNFIDGLLQLSD